MQQEREKGFVHEHGQILDTPGEGPRLSQGWWAGSGRDCPQTYPACKAKGKPGVKTYNISQEKKERLRTQVFYPSALQQV